MAEPTPLFPGATVEGDAQRDVLEWLAWQIADWGQRPDSQLLGVSIVIHFDDGSFGNSYSPIEMPLHLLHAQGAMTLTHCVGSDDD